MEFQKLYQCEVREGEYSRHVYFGASSDGQYHRVLNTDPRLAPVRKDLDRMIEHYRYHWQSQHDRVGDGVRVEVSEPVEIKQVDRGLWALYSSGRIPYAVGDMLDRVGSKHLDHAAEILQGYSADSPYPVEHAWDLRLDHRSVPVALLRLFDRFGVVEDQFTREELRDEATLERKLNRLWGDLLDMRLETFMKPIRESIREHEGV